MRRLVFVSLCLLFPLVLSGCPGPAAPVYPDITFAHLPPLKFDVAEIRVVVEYRPPGKAPNVDHEFRQSPLTVAKRWAADRLRAVGNSGLLTVRIIDASVIETDLELSGGLKGAFTKEQAERYDAVISVEVEAYDRDTSKRATATTSSRRGTSVSEGVSLNDRERTWYDLTDKLMQDFDQAMEREIRRNFGLFLK